MSTINLATLMVLLKLNSQQYEEGTEKAKKKTADLQKMIGGALVGALALAAKAAVQFGKESVAEFQAFEKGISEVYTLLPGISESAMGAMQDDVLNFSRETGRLSDEVIPGVYQAISAGVSQDNVFDFLKVASDAALGGVTDLETAVDGITSVVNAYGEEVIDAASASDVMFTAVKLGKTNFEQLSSSLFNVIPTAASLGVSFEDVAANLAALTAQGTPTSVATTQLRQAFVEASKSGSELDKALRDLHGKGFADLIASGMTSSEIFLSLRDSMPEQEFRDLFGSVEASNAVMGITNETALGIIDAFGTLEDTTGATAAAADVMSDSMQHLEDRANSATEAYKIQMGEAIGPLKRAFLELKIATLENSAANATVKSQFELSNAALMELGLTTGEAGRAITALSTTGVVLSGSLEDAEAMARRTAIAADLLANGFQGTAAELGEEAKRVDETTNGLIGYNDAAGEFYAAQAEAAAATAAVTDGLDEQTSALTVNEDLMRSVNRAMLDFGGSLGPTTQELEDMAYATGDLGDYQEAMLQPIRDNKEAMAAQAEAAAAAEAALAGYFLEALNAKDGAGFFNESLDQLGEQFVIVGGRTAAQNDDLASLQEAYNKAADTVRDYELGIKGANLTDEERAGKIAEQQELMTGLASSMEPLLGITGELTSKNVEATINQDAVNQAIFDAAAAAGGSATELAVLGGALGLYSEDATMAALKSALIQEKIEQLAAAYIAGDTSVAQMREELSGFIGDLDGVAGEMLGAAGDADSMTSSVGSLGTEIGNVSAAAIDAATNLGNIPSDIPVHISITSDPIPTLPNMPGGGNQPQAFALGGFTGGSEGDIAGLVHGQEFVFSAPAVRAIGLPMLEMLHNQGIQQGGGSSVSIGDIYVTPGNDSPVEYGRATRDSLLKTARGKGLRY